MSVPIVVPNHYWYCPKCGAEDLTHEALPHSRFHACPGFFGLTTPMVERGTRANIRLVEREDYVGDETVTTTPDGRPVMALITERDDGQDATVFAPVAKGKVGTA